MDFHETAGKEQKNLRRVLEQLDNPQKRLACIHVAGTNGKGSVCRFLQSILTAGGKKTGLFTSPHLLTPLERISIDGIQLAEEDRKRLFDLIGKAMAEAGVTLTYFEQWAAAAFCWFSEQSCDYALLETGLGGRQDATNVIPPPVCTIITRIGLDHTELLGESLGEIAREKAGIIKKGTKAVIFPEQDREAEQEIFKACTMVETAVYRLRTPKSHPGKDGEHFSLEGMDNLVSPLLGRHQAENAALAVKAAEILGARENEIRQGLLHTRHPGRFEQVCPDPPVIFDGAHNPEGMDALWDTYVRYAFPGQVSVIIGVMEEKKLTEMVRVLKKWSLQVCMTFFTVESGQKRALDRMALRNTLNVAGLKAFSCGSFQEAYLKAQKTGQAVVVCGSLYLYAPFCRELERKKCRSPFAGKGKGKFSS